MFRFKIAQCTAGVLAVAAGGAIVFSSAVTFAAGGAFDGVYKGASKMTLGPDHECGKNFAITVTVADGKFEYTWDRRENAVLIVAIAADGTISGERTFGKKGQVIASGRIAGNALEADLDGKICHRHLSLKKS